MKKLAIWIPLIIMTVIVSIPICVLLKVNDNHVWKYSANYKEYADDFNNVKNFIEEQFSDKTDKWLSISILGDQRTIFDPDANDYLQLPRDVISSVETICNYAFPDKDSNFDTIRIHKSRISFCINNGQYALVFSPNEKPSWVNSPDENIRVKVKSIGDGWYHVTKNR